VVEGFGLGVKSAGKSVFSGLTGIITKPVEGTKKGGVGGFFKVNSLFKIIILGSWKRSRRCSSQTNIWRSRFNFFNNCRYSMPIFQSF
jgi:hypothetical protein